MPIPSSLDFGSVTTGQSSTQSLTIANNGNFKITVASMGTSGAGFSAGGITLPMVLAPGASATLSVSFSPSSTGAATGAVYLNGNNGTTLATVSLAGLGTAPPVHTATLNWVASTSIVIGYYVYRGTTSGGPYTRITGSVVPITSYADSTVQAGGVYYYVVTALDGSYLESGYSAEVQAVIPSP